MGRAIQSRDRYRNVPLWIGSDDQPTRKTAANQPPTLVCRSATPRRIPSELLKFNEITV
jgi:hypothetical protein